MTEHVTSFRGPLTARDRAILEHVARHRITTLQALRKALFADRGVNATIKVASRLCRGGLLQSVPMLHRRRYYALTAAGARSAGTSAKRTGPLGAQALPVEYAALHFACFGSPQRVRLTAAELRRNFPWMESGWLRTAHCLDRSQPDVECLELVRVDLGGAPDHVARKCRADVDRRLGREEFRRMIAEERFRLVVIAATTEGADAIRRALGNHVWPDGVAIRLTVLPELIHFVRGPRHAP